VLYSLYYNSSTTISPVTYSASMIIYGYEDSLSPDVRQLFSDEEEELNFAQDPSQGSSFTRSDYLLWNREHIR
jgi:hypothetical protein